MLSSGEGDSRWPVGGGRRPARSGPGVVRLPPEEKPPKGCLVRKILLFLSALLLLVFILFVVAQTAQVVNFAAAVHPRLGQAVLILLLATYAILAGIPVVLYLRLPRALRLPATDGGPAYDRYLRQLADRLTRNPHLAGGEAILPERESIEGALATLHGRARERIAQTASGVFVTTAVSQSGRLDALMVLVAETRMVWQVAEIYWQRPGVRDLLHLYANVAATVFAAQAVEDLDIGEHLEEVMTPLLAGSAVSAIPGFGIMAQVVMDSVLEGTVNAFLTLRVGCIASQYCRSLTTPERSALRRSAMAEAGGMLAEIALRGARLTSAAVSRAAMRVAKERSVEIGRVVLQGAEEVSAAAAEFAARAGAGNLMSRLRDLALTSAGKAASLLTGAARRDASGRASP